MNNRKDATDGGDGNKSPVHSFNKTDNSQNYEPNNENLNLIIPTKSPSKTRVHPMNTPGTGAYDTQSRKNSKQGIGSVNDDIEQSQSSVVQLPKINEQKNVYVDSMNMDHENIEKTQTFQDNEQDHLMMQRSADIDKPSQSSQNNSTKHLLPGKSSEESYGTTAAPPKGKAAGNHNIQVAERTNKQFDSHDKQKLIDELAQIEDTSRHHMGAAHALEHVTIGATIGSLDQAAAFKGMYANQFGKKFDMATKVTNYLQIMPKQNEFMFQVVTYTLPVQTQMVMHHDRKGQVQSTQLKDQLGLSSKKSAFLQMYKYDSNNWTLEKQIEHKLDSLIISLSKDGRFMAILEDNRTFCLYDATVGGAQLMEKVAGKKSLVKVELKNKQSNIKFSNDGSLVATWSDGYLNLIDCDELKYKKCHQYSSGKYKRLVNVTMDQRNGNACYAILQHRDSPQVDMFEITRQQFMFSNIQCETQDLSQLKVLVNKNHTFALFSNNGENFAVHLFGGNPQRLLLPHLSGHSVMDLYDDNEGETPLVLCSHNGTMYMKSFSSTADFEIPIREASKDDSYASLDIQKNEDGSLVLASLSNNDLYIDVIKNNEQTCRQVIKQFEYNAMCASWPYISYQVSLDKLTVVHVQDACILHQVEIPQSSEILKISMYHDQLFFITNTSQGIQSTYQIYQVNLNLISELSTDIEHQQSKGALKVFKIFEYRSSDVDSKPLVNFFVCQREERDRVVAVTQHGDSLYQQNVSVTHETGQPVVAPVAIKMDDIDGSVELVKDNLWVYRQMTESANDFHIRSLKYCHNYVESGSVFRVFCDFGAGECILNWLLDIEQDRILIFIGPLGDKDEGLRAKHQARFYSISSGKCLQTVDIHDENIETVLNSQRIISQGHIYFQNSVCKIRYDLFGGTLTQDNQLFNIFNDTLDTNDSFMTGCPFIDACQNKLFYITSNPGVNASKEAQFIPMLHQREIKLGHIDNQATDDIFQTQYQGGSTDLKFLSLNITQQRYSIIDACGLIEKTIYIHEDFKKYGQLLQVSSNGHILVFAKDLEVKIEQKGGAQRISNELASITMHRMTDKGLYFMKEIPLKERLELYLEKVNELKTIFPKGACEDIDTEAIAERFEAMKCNKAMYYTASVNDKLDICIQMLSLQDQQIQNAHHAFIQCNGGLKLDSRQRRVLEEAYADMDGSMFYYERGRFAKKGILKKAMNDTQSFIRHIVQQRVFCDPKNEIRGFRISEDQIFTWGIDSINQLELFNEEQGFEQLPLTVQADAIKIHKVVTSTAANGRYVMIVIQLPASKSASLWDLEEHSEVANFEVGDGAEVHCDAKGKFYIVHGDRVMIVDQEVSLCCFNVSAPANRERRSPVDFSLGIKFDAENFEWLINDHALKTSYSFMTFMMHQKTAGTETFAFDLEKFNFIIRQNSILSLCLYDDYDGKADLLERFSTIDKALIDLVHYKYRKNPYSIGGDYTTVLEHAEGEARQRYVDLYLKYLCHVDQDTSLKFAHLMCRFVSSPYFARYMCSLAVKTSEFRERPFMKLNLADAVSGEIWAQATSDGLSFPEHFFLEELGDSPGTAQAGYSSVAVDVTALRADWLLAGDLGLDFFETIHDVADLAVCDCLQLRALIQFLYSDLQKTFLRVQFPIYACQLGMFYLAIHCNESANTYKTNNDGKAPPHMWIFYLLYVIHIIVLLTTFVDGLKVAGRAQKKGRLGAVFFWTVLPLLNDLLNLIFIFLLAGGEAIYVVRNIATVLTLTLWFKFALFLQLHDPIAPLINIVIQTFSGTVNIVIILLVLTFAFANAFYFVGQNQMDYADIKAANEPDYASGMLGALFHITQIALGQLNTGAYSAGKTAPGENIMLWILYFLSIYVFLLVLLNLLIAIMGDIFQQSYDNQDLAVTRDHLRFVIDNWSKKKDYGQMKYIVTAHLNK